MVALFVFGVVSCAIITFLQVTFWRWMVTPEVDTYIFGPEGLLFWKLIWVNLTFYVIAIISFIVNGALYMRAQLKLAQKFGAPPAPPWV